MANDLGGRDRAAKSPYTNSPETPEMKPLTHKFRAAKSPYTNSPETPEMKSLTHKFKAAYAAPVGASGDDSLGEKDGTGKE